MNHLYGNRENGLSTREEIRRSIGTVVCPKPRRLNPNSSVNNVDHSRFRCNLSHQVEIGESSPATDLLDIILTKEGGSCSHVELQQSSNARVALSPPFFGGSPPSRVANPLIQDVRFGDEKICPLSLSGGFSSSPSSPNSSARKGVGYVWANFGNNPAVRIEGFDCLNRDRRNCGIPALA